MRLLEQIASVKMSFAIGIGIINQIAIPWLLVADLQLRMDKIGVSARIYTLMPLLLLSVWLFGVMIWKCGYWGAERREFANRDPYFAEMLALLREINQKLETERSKHQ